MREDITNTIAQSLGLDPLEVEENKLLREDLGLDETELEQILKVIQEKYDFTLTPDEVANVRSVGDLLDISESVSPKTGI